MIKKYNKKSQIGATLTWFIAFIIIFFILTMFLFFAMAIGGAKKVINILSPGGGAGDLSSLSDDAVLRANLFSVLESKSELNKKTLDSILAYTGQNAETDKAIKMQLEEKLGKICSSYVFDSPILKIDKTIPESDTGKQITIFIPYKGQTIKLNYFQSKICG